jgi:hypothetical protein
MKKMKLVKVLWGLCMSAFFLVACGEDNSICNPLPVLTTGTASSITEMSAIVTGNIIAPECGEPLISQGFVYAITEFPKNTDSIVEVSGEEISTEVTSLKQNTTYYYRTYFTNATETYYGEQKSFTTQVGGATSNTVSVTNITAVSAEVGVEILSNGGGEITSQGVCWSTNNAPTLADFKTEASVEASTFSSTLIGLTAATIYYVRSYATNEAGTSYGEEQSFTTLDGVIKFSESVVTKKTITSAKVSCMVTDNGGAAVIVQGVCWSTSPNPNFEDNDSSEINYVSDSFTRELLQLQEGTLYYYRPYAINAVGTTYGEESSFIAVVPEIGDETAGGIVFYIAEEPTDLDGDGVLDTGLVCATEDQSAYTVRWYNGSFIATGATASGLGSGATNTATIIEAQGEGSYAASVASNYDGGGFNDWFLPSRAELNLMYTNLKVEGLGNFQENHYWSASESRSNTAWKQSFINGTDTGNQLKSSSNRVRAVRAF